MVDPSKVFSPDGPVDAEYFVDRDETSSLLEYLDRYQGVPIISGISGAGKTSMVEYLRKTSWKKKNVVRIEMKHYTDLNLIRDIVYRKITGATSEKIGGHTAIEGEGSILVVKGKVKGQENYAKIADDPVEEIKMLLSSGILILDNLEHTSLEFSERWIELITSFADSKEATLILIGIGDTYDDVLGMPVDPSDSLYGLWQQQLRRIREIHVNPLSRSQAILIIENGMKKLKLKISKELCNSILNISSGDLSIIHQISLESAYLAREEKLKEINRQVIEKSLQKIAKHWKKKHEKWYQKAKPKKTRKPNQVALRLKILFILAFSREEIVSSGKIKEQLKKLKSSYNIDPELKSLIDWGQIKRIHHGEYRISDPRYKLYIRLVCRIEYFSMYMKLAHPEDPSLDEDTELVKGLINNIRRKVDGP